MNDITEINEECLLKNQSEEEIKKELINLGFRINSMGYILWINALLFLKENICNFKGIMNLYTTIGNKFNYDPRNVERMMRYSLNPAKENIRKKYNVQSQKIDNKGFIYLKMGEYI